MTQGGDYIERMEVTLWLPEDAPVLEQMIASGQALALKVIGSESLPEAASGNADTEHKHAQPVLDEDGLLRHRGKWVSLPAIDQRLVGVMLARYGSVAGRTALADAAWPDGAPSDNALDVHISRLRRRIAQIGLEIRTVRSRGYLLQPAERRA